MGFLGVKDPILETELEARLVEKVKQFLLELGKGFTYIGNQHVLEYNGKLNKVDMLFFHRGLHCLVAIDLKIGEFKPEYAGKMNYYLSLLDRLVGKTKIVLSVSFYVQRKTVWKLSLHWKIWATPLVWQNIS